MRRDHVGERPVPAPKPEVVELRTLVRVEPLRRRLTVALEAEARTVRELLREIQELDVRETAGEVAGQIRRVRLDDGDRFEEVGRKEIERDDASLGIRAPAGKIDVTDFVSNPIEVTAGSPATPINLGGLNNIIYATDPFVMEYADGLSDLDVGWGQLTAGGISQTSRLYNLVLDLEYRTPYLARVQSSNVASHVVRSLVQAATGNPTSGALANPSTKVIVLIAANTNLASLAGLFHLDWLLPGYQADVAAPSGALVFELRQSQCTGEYIVRASYVSQTMDQLRNRAVLTLDAPPAIAPVFIPGCSVRNATFDCSLWKFVDLARHTIDPKSADLVN